MPNSAVPATNAVAPAAAHGPAVPASIPPSTSIATPGPSSARSRSSLPSEAGHERLPAPARVDGHAQQEVEVFEHLEAALDRRGRAEHEAGRAARLAHGLQRVVDVRRRLGVDADVVGAGLREVRDVTLGALDHQVDVDERARGVDLLRQRVDDQRAHADRGHEVPSMTSTWIVVAPASSTAATWSPSRAKSAARIEGATPFGVISPGASSPAVVADVQRGVGHPHDRRVLAAVRAHRAQLEAMQAVHAAVAAGQVGRPQPRLVARRADVAEIDGVVAHERLSRAMKKPSVPWRCGSV